MNAAALFTTFGVVFLAELPDKSAIAFACGLGVVALMAVYAVRGLRRAERGL